MSVTARGSRLTELTHVLTCSQWAAPQGGYHSRDMSMTTHGKWKVTGDESWYPWQLRHSCARGIWETVVPMAAGTQWYPWQLGHSGTHDIWDVIPMAAETQWYPWQLGHNGSVCNVRLVPGSRGGVMLMRSSDDQLKRHRIIRLCSSHRCVEVTQDGGGRGSGGSYLEESMRMMVSGTKGDAYHPTLPPEIATDAAIYVTVIVVFYAAIILLLVGTNLHRLRRQRRSHTHQPHLQHKSQHQRLHSPSQRTVDTTTSATNLLSSTFFSSPLNSNGSTTTTTILPQKERWSDQGGAVIV
ncbi:uncharacterized protein LOC121862625 [Homarus americanus]|uniref:uncharacterized protein LOC121862625 n=1 Tax=Homarus americanus TaxID=6706 RepID=UPI001C46C575|nr:uncharacterized protein LOC121862625 [Homarus americanus]